MNKKAYEALENIKAIRSRNNINWMNILFIAAKYAPEETAAELSRVFTADSLVVSATQDLVRALRGDAGDE